MCSALITLPFSPSYGMEREDPSQQIIRKMTENMNKIENNLENTFVKKRKKNNAEKALYANFKKLQNIYSSTVLSQNGNKILSFCKKLHNFIKEKYNFQSIPENVHEMYRFADRILQPQKRESTSEEGESQWEYYEHKNENTNETKENIHKTNNPILNLKFLSKKNKNLVHEFREQYIQSPKTNEIIFDDNTSGSINTALPKVLKPTNGDPHDSSEEISTDFEGEDDSQETSGKDNASDN